ncbi:hypothetical protein D3C81_751030 [compost metagenome]|uniref:Uncharacterized protein n=1 Tax=Cupriavidus campinensis TaxID=151783 RepID=A0AAE9I0W3_9BURK|nr:hypothetical protein [Cupriavidus campinensis]URF05449.1 hypothetical protein M5D45_06495 [Cupriavidus campinensis]
MSNEKNNEAASVAHRLTDEQIMLAGMNHFRRAQTPEAALSYIASVRECLTLAAAAAPAPFQPRVQPWMLECFGAEIAADVEERNHRFLEEALELVQACDCTRSEAHQLVDYVFDRPAGEKRQEVGGVMVTLAALCLAQSLDMHEAGEIELTRIWTKVDQIRAKQAAKPKHSPLPMHTGRDPAAGNTTPISANSAEITPGTLPYPTEPTDALLDVLGLMLYTTTPIAHALRAAGTDIPKRCEEEQAHVLHWLIQLTLQHGAEWRARAAKSIEELQAATRKPDWRGESDALEQGDEL